MIASILANRISNVPCSFVAGYHTSMLTRNLALLKSVEAPGQNPSFGFPQRTYGVTTIKWSQAKDQLSVKVVAVKTAIFWCMKEDMKFQGQGTRMP